MRRASQKGKEEFLFRFIQPVSGITFAIEDVHFGKIYPPGAIEDVDIMKLRQQLEKLPCGYDQQVR